MSDFLSRYEIAVHGTLGGVIMYLIHFLRRSISRAETLFGPVDWSRSFAFVRFPHRPVGLGYSYQEILTPFYESETYSGAIVPVLTYRQLSNLIVGRTEGAEVFGFCLSFPDSHSFGAGLVVKGDVLGKSHITFCDIYDFPKEETILSSNLYFSLTDCPEQDNLILSHFLNSTIQIQTQVSKYQRIGSQLSWKAGKFPTPNDEGLTNYSLLKKVTSLPIMLASTPDEWEQLQIDLPRFSHKYMEVFSSDPDKPPQISIVPIFKNEEEEVSYLRSEFGEIENFRFRYLLFPSLFESGYRHQCTPVFRKDLRRKG